MSAQALCSTWSSSFKAFGLEPVLGYAARRTKSETLVDMKRHDSIVCCLPHNLASYLGEPPHHLPLPMGTHPSFKVISWAVIF